MNNQSKPVWIVLIALIGLMPWLVVQLEMALNTNHAWLFTAAMRFLEGGNHLQDAYEPNPPLSVLLYYPAVLLSKYFSILPDYSIYLMGLLGLGISTAALWVFIRPLQFITQTEKTLFCSIYVAAGCIIPSNLFFAERDEFVFWGLVPFLVAQLMITYGYQFKGLKNYAFMMVCAVFILIKPHFILFPALLFLYRFAIQRDLTKSWYAPDLWALITACVLYALTIVIFFPTYLSEVLPSFVEYYISYPSDGVFPVLLERIFLCGLILGALRFVSADKFYKQASFAFVLSALISYSLYILQMKGFGYHLIPGDLFVFIGAVSILYGALRRVLPSEGVRCSIVLIVTLLAGYITVPLKAHSQTHESYAQLLLPQTVKECGQPCPFFIFSENMEMIWQTSIYTGQQHASRFPGLWWLHSMLEKGYDPAEKQKYAIMVAEDLARYDPKMLIIAKNLKTVHGETFNLIEFFSDNESFKDQISRYKLEKSMSDDVGPYFKGTSADYKFIIEYDVYIRR